MFQGHQYKKTVTTYVEQNLQASLGDGISDKEHEE